MPALRIVAILIGGAVGALSRFGLSRYISGQLVSSVFPWATLVINAAGSFAIGFFFELFGRYLVSSALRDFVVVGFLGAFTTFSTFALETLNLIRDNEWGWGAFNLVASNVLGIVMVIVGVLLGRLVVRA